MTLIRQIYADFIFFFSCVYQLNPRHLHSISWAMHPVTKVLRWLMKPLTLWVKEKRFGQGNMFHPAVEKSA
jgi:hypothetical protein